MACDELAKTLIERRVYIQTTDREQVKACNRFFVYALRAINTCVKVLSKNNVFTSFVLLNLRMILNGICSHVRETASLSASGFPTPLLSSIVSKEKQKAKSLE